MELVEKLESSANAFLKGIKTLEATEKSLTLQVQTLEQRKGSYLKDIATLEAKRSALDASVNQERQEKLEAIDKKHKEAIDKDTNLQRQLSITMAKQTELDALRRDLENFKTYYEGRVAEYETLTNELKEKKSRLQAAMG